MIGLVLIGRNEGARLEACIQSIKPLNLPAVYVDSGSTDSSVAYALKEGLQVVNLDLSKPFSAGRARNEGFKVLLQKHADLKYVQFIDGDCLLGGEWLGAGADYLELNSKCSIVCGVRKELYPDKTIFNFLCDIESMRP